MGCYVAAYLAAGNTVKVGDTIDIPEIGSCEVLSNDSISAGAATGDENNGVVLLQSVWYLPQITWMIMISNY